MSYIGDKILKLTRQLYPTGRAWKLPFNGYFESLHKALAVSEAQAYTDAVSILDSLLPDNPNFTAADAAEWEERLGLDTNTSTSLSLRMLAIKRKMQSPGINPARANAGNLQYQLRLAGFDVYVFENRFPVYPNTYYEKTIQQFANLNNNQYGDHQYGDIQYGFEFSDVVVNSMDQAVDSTFTVPADLRSTFFIGGLVAGSYASMPASRKIEFRHLVLQLKQAHTVAYLLINYT